MKLNEIKYLPKSNAVADVYTKATGMPIVGEMMVAAAGQGGEPTPPTPPTPTKAEAPTYTYSQDTTYCSNYDVTLYGNLTVNLATTTPNATIYMKAILADTITAEDYDWSRISPWVDSSSYTYNIGGVYNGNALMIAYAAADGMEDSDYTYITLPYNTTEARTCDEVSPVYDLKFEYGGSGEIMSVTAKTLTDLTSNRIYISDGTVDIQLVQNDSSDDTLTLDPNYPNTYGDLYDSHIYGQLTIYDQEDTEVYSGSIVGDVVPYVEVYGVNVNTFDLDNYDIQVNLDFQPQEWINFELEGTLEGCEETLHFSQMDGFHTNYNGQANFVDGGTYTLTDSGRTLTLTGTYNFMPLT